MVSKTTAPPRAVVTKAMASEAVTAIALIIGKGLGRELSVQDLSGLFVDLRAVDLQGFALNTRIAMRRVPGGFFSEDIHGWAGRLASAGYAEWGSSTDPIKLNERGWRLCREMLVEELEHDPLRSEFLTSYFVKVLRNR